MSWALIRARSSILRTLIDEIRLHPTNEELQIELIGDLATLLDFAGDYQPDKTKPGYTEYPGRTKWLVAGAGFGPFHNSPKMVVNF